MSGTIGIGDLAVLCAHWLDVYGGGDGTQENPYLIYTPEQMNAIGTNPDDFIMEFDEVVTKIDNLRWKRPQ